MPSGARAVRLVATFVHQDEIWVVGGGQGAHGGGSDKIWIYNIAQNKWRTSSIVLPHRALSNCSKIAGGYLYLFGGGVNSSWFNSGTMPKMQRYRLDGGTTPPDTDAPNAPTGLTASVP